MTHIACHPPDADESYFSASPLYRMFGYLRLADQDKPQKLDNDKGEFRFLFMNNTGYQFEKEKNRRYKPVGVHLMLFPIAGEALKNKKLKGKKFCCIGFDLVEYGKHKATEDKFIELGGVKLEFCSPETIDSTLAEIGDKFSDDEKIILAQSARYMTTESFKCIYFQKSTTNRFPGKKQTVNEWLRANVVDFEATKEFIFGCGKGQNDVVVRKDFSKFLNQCMSKQSSSNGRGHESKAAVHQASQH